jgi:hypothetical protein
MPGKLCDAVAWRSEKGASGQYQQPSFHAGRGEIESRLPFPVKPFVITRKKPPFFSVG